MPATTAAERDDAVRGLRRQGAGDRPGARAGAAMGGALRPRRARLRLLGFRVDRDYPRGAGLASVMKTAEVPPRSSTARPAAGRRRLPRPLQPELHRARRALGGPRRQPAAGRDRRGLDPQRLRHPRALGGGRARPADPPLPALTATRYVRFDGELKQLVRTLRHRGRDESAATLVRWIATGWSAPDGPRPLALRPLVGAGPPVAQGPAPGVEHQDTDALS